MKEQTKNEIRELLVGGLVGGLFVGLFSGFSYVIVAIWIIWIIIGLLDRIYYGFSYERVSIWVIGIITGVVYVLVTQIIAYFNQPELFSAFEFWGKLILLIIINVVGWSLVIKLGKEEK